MKERGLKMSIIFTKRNGDDDKISALIEGLVAVNNLIEKRSLTVSSTDLTQESFINNLLKAFDEKDDIDTIVNTIWENSESENDSKQRENTNKSVNYKEKASVIYSNMVTVAKQTIESYKKQNVLNVVVSDNNTTKMDDDYYTISSIISKIDSYIRQKIMEDRRSIYALDMKKFSETLTSKEVFYFDSAFDQLSLSVNCKYMVISLYTVRQKLIEMKDSIAEYIDVYNRYMNLRPSIYEVPNENQIISYILFEWFHALSNKSLTNDNFLKQFAKLTDNKLVSEITRKCNLCFINILYAILEQDITKDEFGIFLEELMTIHSLNIY